MIKNLNQTVLIKYKKTFKYNFSIIIKIILLYQILLLLS